MKRNIFRFSVLIFASLVFISTGCKKNSNDSSLLVFDMHAHFGADSLVYGTTYSNSLGRHISFTRVAFYLSGIQLTSTAGIPIVVGGEILDTAATVAQYIAGGIPVGAYKSVSFLLGLADSLNHNDPSSYSTGPLTAQSPSMHFASDSLGYIFMTVEGLVDTSVAGTGTPNVPFSYHIGTDALLESIILPDHSVAPYNLVFNAAGGKLIIIHLTADFSKLLQNIDMRANRVTSTNDYPILADTLASHIPGMFSYQQ
jgi:hypothetical protein